MRDWSSDVCSSDLIVTEDSAKELALEPGKKVTALIKASHVIVGAYE